MITPLLSRLLSAALILSSASIQAEEPAASFKAGTAKRDITPKEPVPMWGDGARHDALSAGMLDPLYAAVLVIQAGDKKVAIVGLDLGRSPAEKSLQNIRQRIKTEAGIEYSFIAGSHTHHGPVLELTDEPGKGKGKFDAARPVFGHDAVDLRCAGVGERAIVEDEEEYRRPLPGIGQGPVRFAVNGFDAQRADFGVGRNRPVRSKTVRAGAAQRIAVLMPRTSFRMPSRFTMFNNL